MVLNWDNVSLLDGRFLSVRLRTVLCEVVTRNTDSRNWRAKHAPLLRHLILKMSHFPYEVPVLGSAGILVMAWGGAWLARKVIDARDISPKEHYRLYRLVNTTI